MRGDSTGSNARRHAPNVSRYVWGIAAIWSFTIGILLAFDLWEMRGHIYRLAALEARVALDEDVANRWVAFHGGVYTPTTGANQSSAQPTSPLPQESTTNTAHLLTLMDPAYLNRHALEMAKDHQVLRSRITSLNPVRPENAPDAWEAVALQSFALGKTEYSAIADVAGKPHYRLMTTLVTEKGCLTCHAAQGYKEGDVRGGVSVSIPLAPYLSAERDHRLSMLTGYGTTWALGLLGLGIGSRRLRHNIRQREQAEQGLLWSRISLDVSSDALFWLTPDGRISDVNAAACRSLEYSRDELLQLSVGDVDIYYSAKNWSQHFEDLRHHGSLSFESVQRAKDGRLIPVEIVANYVQIGGEERNCAFVRDISDRKRVEDALKDLATSLAHLSGKQFFEAVTKHIATAIGIDYAFVGELTDSMDTVKVLGGYARGEAMGDMTYSLSGTPCNNVVGGETCVYFSSVQSQFPEDTLLRTMGIESYLGAPVLNKTGQPIGIMVGLHSKSLQDSKGISRLFTIFLDRVSAEMQRSRVEEALQESEERMRLFFERQLVGAAILSPEKRWIQVNDRLCQMLGYSREELIQMTWAALTHEEDVALDVALFTRILDGEIDEYVFEKRFIRKDGTVVHTNVSVACIRNTGEGVRYALALLDDISERKRAEAALRESESELRQVIDLVPHSIYAKDSDSRFILINQRSAELMGSTTHDAVGKTQAELTSLGAEADALVAEDKEVIARQIPVFKREHVYTDSHGVKHIEEITKIPFITRRTRGVAVLGISEDITERKRAEEESKKLQEQLAQAQKMESVGRLAGGVAHDFNNMLTVILGHAEMAIDQLDAEHPLHSNLEEIRQAAQRSSDLTSQLLAFARKQPIAPKALDLNEVIAGMLKMLKRLIGEHIRLEWKPDPDLWRVKMDASQIDQILVNLCVNARDAISDTGKVTIETRNCVLDDEYCANYVGLLPGDYILLAVSDTGCGMDKDMISRLFEPFFTTKAVGRGTGLGLATVYGAVKQNNGYIDVYSEPKLGTTFRIRLPRYAGTAELTRTGTVSRTDVRGQETILLVEDEPAILELATKMLQQQGYTVLAASTPGEGLRMAQERSGVIHLLITDVVMPEMNGRDLSRNLESLYPDLKRLFMSGYTADVIAHHGVLDEGVHFIQKPFSLKDLASAVRDALEGVVS